MGQARVETDFTFVWVRLESEKISLHMGKVRE